MSGPVERPPDAPGGGGQGIRPDEMGRRIEESWRDFRGLVASFPAERFGERLDAGWTRKQMLAHVCAWHDQASDRLARFLVSGEPVQSTEAVDTFNARAARAAEGRTAGEIIRWLDDSHGRLRRLASRLSPAQFAAHDGWAATVVAENTWQHYDDHRADVAPAGA